MTERQASIAANKIYRAIEFGYLTRRGAILYLCKIAPFFNTHQLHKYSDLIDFVRNNPELADE